MRLCILLFVNTDCYLQGLEFHTDCSHVLPCAGGVSSVSDSTLCRPVSRNSAPQVFRVYVTGRQHQHQHQNNEINFTTVVRCLSNSPSMIRAIAAAIILLLIEFGRCRGPSCETAAAPIICVGCWAQWTLTTRLCTVIYIYNVVY